MERLPRGLLSTATKEVSADLNGADSVDVADVARLWRGERGRTFSLLR